MIRYLIPTAIFAAIAILSSGCPAKLKPEKPQLGAETSMESVAKALNKAVGNKSPLDRKLNERAFYETNYRVEMGVVVRTLTDEIQVVEHSIDPDNGNIHYLMVESTVDYQVDPPAKKVIEHQPEEYKNPNSSDGLATNSALNPLSLVAQSALDLSSALVGISAEEEGPPVTFHNLRVSTIDFDAPKAIKNKPNCMGFADCKIHATEIKVDAAVWGCKNPKQCPNDWKKSQLQWIRSTETPYLATELLVCKNFLYDPTGNNQSRNYFVRFCDVLLDFDIGKDPF